ncbi:MAG TPA: glycosyltransferase [Tepidisphaeraceae bacterium]|nr:glycosyltransferase [Tepidisphaeraceae bacterium]
MAGMDIAFFASSLVSAYWNGAATYYRGIVRAMAERGHRVTFYEPDAYDRQKHRDIEDPPWAKVVVYSSNGTDAVLRCLDDARGADLIVKASGVGVFDELLEAAVLDLKTPENLVAFWDVDAPATLERVSGGAPIFPSPGTPAEGRVGVGRANIPLEVERIPNKPSPQPSPGVPGEGADPFRPLIPRYDVILTYGGGDPVVNAYEGLGAKQCVPIYNALDPSTHHAVQPDARFDADLGLLANRLPDREARIDDFFFRAAAALPDHRFLLGGNGWQDKARPANVDYVGHVYTRDHNAFNCTPRAVLNVSRESMARFGFSPATRVFEAAGAGACLITDFWEGIDLFLEPGEEVLVARDGAEVARHLESLDPAAARKIGAAAQHRVLSKHTYAHRAEYLEAVLNGLAPSHTKLSAIAS